VNVTGFAFELDTPPEKEDEIIEVETDG